MNLISAVVDEQGNVKLPPEFAKQKVKILVNVEPEQESDVKDLAYYTCLEQNMADWLDVENDNLFAF